MEINVYFCLVHEARDCVIDLIQNLSYLDPESRVLICNGGSDEHLLQEIPTSVTGNVQFVANTLVNWSNSFQGVISGIRFALAHCHFDTFTLIDSDQLALRHGFSAFLRQLAIRDTVGMIAVSHGSSPKEHHLVAIAQHDAARWKELFGLFPQCRPMPYWTCWPGVVLTSGFCEKLIAFVDQYENIIDDILSRSIIPATQEVLIPTLATLMGFEVRTLNINSSFVRWTPPFSVHDVERALTNEFAFFIHPVERHYDDPVRCAIRKHWGGYGANLAESAL